MKLWASGQLNYANDDHQSQGKHLLEFVITDAGANAMERTCINLLICINKIYNLGGTELFREVNPKLKMRDDSFLHCAGV